MSHLDAYDWISPLPPTPDVPPQVQAAQKRQQNFRDEAHVSNDKSIPGYQRLHGVAPGEMCTLDSRTCVSYQVSIVPTRSGEMMGSTSLRSKRPSPCLVLPMKI